jgi:hypothetical protein
MQTHASYNEKRKSFFAKQQPLKIGPGPSEMLASPCRLGMVASEHSGSNNLL